MVLDEYDEGSSGNESSVPKAFRLFGVACVRGRRARDSLSQPATVPQLAVVTQVLCRTP